MDNNCVRARAWISIDLFFTEEPCFIRTLSGITGALDLSLQLRHLSETNSVFDLAAAS